MRKRAMPAIVATLKEKMPRIAPVAVHLQNISTKKFVLIVAEEFMLIVIALMLFLDYSIYPLLALFWGFSIHLVMHIGQAVAIRKYIPGLLTSILLLPYCALGVVHTIERFSITANLALAVFGFATVAINLLVMHKILK